MSLKARAIICVLLIVLWATPTTPAVALDAQDDGAVQSVQNLLDARTTAILANDVALFASTIDPQASQAFRDKEMLRFAGAATVAFEGLRIFSDTQDSGNLAAGLDLAKKHGAEAAFLPATKREYRLSTYDTQVAIDTFWYTYVKRGDNWFVAADDDLSAVGLRNSVALWDFGPVAAQPTEHFLMLSSQQKALRAEELGALAERAMTQFQKRWTLGWSERLVVIIPDSGAQAADLLQTASDVANFVAFVSYTPQRDDTTYEVSAPRLYAQEDNLLNSTDQRQVDDLTHELVHAAAAHQSGPFTPVWLHEGLAEFIRLGLPGLRPPPADVSSLPGPDAFSGSGAALSKTYEAATSAVTYAASLRGNDAPQKLFLAIGKRRITPGTPAYNLDIAMSEALGIDLAEFEKGWLASRNAA